jgi:hypothetical protein
MGLLLTKLHLIAAFMFLFSAPGIYIAYAKGRSLLEGFILGAFLGPIGWIIEGLLPTKK